MLLQYLLCRHVKTC